MRSLGRSALLACRGSICSAQQWHSSVGGSGAGQKQSWRCSGCNPISSRHRRLHSRARIRISYIVALFQRPVKPPHCRGHDPSCRAVRLRPAPCCSTLCPGQRRARLRPGCTSCGWRRASGVKRQASPESSRRSSAFPGRRLAWSRKGRPAAFVGLDLGPRRNILAR